MGSSDDEAEKSLLSESRDHPHLHVQRRRPRRGSVSETEINLLEQNVVQNPSHSRTAAEPQAEFDFKPVFLWLATYLGAGT